MNKIIVVDQSQIKVMDVIGFLIFVMVMIVSSCPELGRNEVLYISPSPTVTCPGKPCLTLHQFAANVSQTNTTLLFLPGIHQLNLRISVSYISKFSLLSYSTLKGSQVNITCHQSAGFTFNNIDSLRIGGLYFLGCGNNRALSVKLFTIENSVFQGQNDSETALVVNETNTEIRNSSFFSNTVGSYLCIFSDIGSVYIRVGGAVFVIRSNITIVESNFVGNSAEVGGAMYICKNSNVKIIDSVFVQNQATPADLYTQCSDSALHRSPQTENGMMAFNTCSGGVITMFESRITISGSMFSNNTNKCVNGGAGALSVQQDSSATLYNSKFWYNTVKGFGGAIIVKRRSNTRIYNTAFYYNSAHRGGVMEVVLNSKVIVSDSKFYNNSAALSGGVIATDRTSQLYDIGSQFKNNIAVAGGVLSAHRSTVTFTDSIFSNNQATESGGALYIVLSEVTFNSSLGLICNLTNNFAGNGGALYATESTINIKNGAILIMSNVASDNGGGLYLYHSNLFGNVHFGGITKLNISSNKANNSGGGVHAINSLITLYCDRSYSLPNNVSLHFIENTAHKGGGICLESAAQLRIIKIGEQLFNETLLTSIYFKSNTADYGNAIYVIDETYFDVCTRGSNTLNNTTASTAQCFIQVLSLSSTLKYKPNIVGIEFTTNHSDYSSGSTIVGGLLDRCLPDPHAEIFIDGYLHKEVDGMTYLELISNINDTKTISSSPVKICFCTPDDQPDCNYEPHIIQVMKGKSFNVSLVAVDQVNHTVSNTDIHIFLHHPDSFLGEDQSLQMTDISCTNLTFRIYSQHDGEQLTFYAEGPCRNSSMSQRKISVTFLPCTCPIGFQPNSTEKNCVCICDIKLSPYITDPNCDYQTELLVRESNFWITFIEFNESNASCYLIYRYCPYDYCLPRQPINLNIINGADAQCANNRSGILCGVCQPELSLSLGSSHCIHCPKDWYKNFIAIVIGTLLAGIVLVALLMVLNLTVAVGTLNGLIFYANIIGANSSTFFTGSSYSTRFLSIIISLINLNLEVGFEICFFEGMDTYWKTWLQLFFPTYVIFLVVMVIIISEHSMRFSRLIANKNPVATLATLILLSYTMFLRSTIAILSFANLNYPRPDGSHKSERVWLPDASVKYLGGKHIALFIAAILILIVGIAYTYLLFFWQWLLHHQNKTAFKWVRYQRLGHFIEPYHAPYVFKHRYWTGLLLFARVALHLVFALNMSGDPGVNFLAVVVLIGSIFFLKGCHGKIYKINVVDVLEMVCYLNIGIFSATQLLLLERGFEQTVNVDAPAYISGTITLILLLAVLIYHGFTAFLSLTKTLKKCMQRENRYDENGRDNDDFIGHPTSKTTSTVVEGPQNLDNSRFKWSQMSCSIDEHSNLLHFQSPNYDTTSNRQYGSTLS